MDISLVDYRYFWSRARETTSSYPCAISFSTMKAGSSSNLISAIECHLTRIPLLSGYSPLRWRRCLDVMIPKKSGVTTLNGLRTICLFATDCNFAFKHIGRAMMGLAEKTQALAPEQYGSQKRRRATDLAVNKALTYDIIRQLKRPAAVCSKDAKSCYDLIGHTQASLAMQRMGVPKAAVDCLFSTPQGAIHRVRTGYGDSAGSYGGNAWLLPFHGIGQGNGAGPAIWAVVSTPLLNILREMGFGLSYVAPITNLPLSFSGFAFVDDTDLLQMLHHDSSAEEVRTAIQEVVHHWEGLLAATAGAIVPEKTFWYLLDFTWHRGDWRYKTIAECPGDISAKDLSGEEKIIRRLEADDAAETLGIFLAPSGSRTGQIAKLQGKVLEWVKHISSGRLSKAEMWTAVQSTILRTLSYPLPAVTLTKQEWEAILSPLLRCVLPRLGICRNFPRALVHAPSKFFGLDFKHLYTVQEITRLQGIIIHTANGTITGRLYRASFELLLIEIGSFLPLHLQDFETVGHLATDSLMKSTWEFLTDHNLQLITDLKVDLPRQDDCYLLTNIIPLIEDFDHLTQINRCQLYLRVIFLSDVVDGSGKELLAAAWNGERILAPQ
jgi:hypothetical protein